MYPKTHIILGFIFSLCLYLIFPQIDILEASIILLSSLLIDVDHYLYYVLRKKDISLKRAYQWFVELRKKYKKLNKIQRKKIAPPICFLHGLESIIILVLLSYFVSPLFFYVFLGFIFHQFLDFIDITNNAGNYDKVISVIYSLLIRRNKNKRIIIK